MAYQLGGVSLGQVQSEQVKADNGVVEFPVPNGTPDKVELVAVLGAIKRISITGVITGTVVQLQNFVSSLEGWVIAGGQIPTATLYYQSDLISPSGTMSVRVEHADYAWELGAPTKLNYSIDMVQGINA